MSDQLVEEATTYTTLDKHDAKYPCLQRPSNPRFQQFFTLDRTAAGIGFSLSLGIPYISVGTVTRLRTG